MKSDNHLKCCNYAAWNIISQVGVNNSGSFMEKSGIVKKRDGNERNRIFVYEKLYYLLITVYRQWGREDGTE